MIKNISLTVEDTADFIAKIISAQKRALDSLVKVVLDSRVALDYFFAEQGAVCSVANTTCCTRINTSGEAETQVTLDP